MPFPSAALTAGNLTSLRGSDAVTRYAAAQFCSLAPNTTVFAARVNGAPSGASYAQITYDTVTVGAFGDIRVGQTVYLSASNSIRAAYFGGRIRAAPTSTLLYVNETSAVVADNDFIFVVDDFRLTDKLAREVGTVQFKDYDISFRAIPPVVRNLQTVYAGWCSASNVLRIAFDVSASFAATSGATISSYAWTFPAGTTVISGSAATAIVTVDIPHSAGAWIHLLVTDSGGRTVTRHTFVHPASDTFPPSLGFTGAATGFALDGEGNASIEAFAGVSSVLDNTLLVVWSQEYYNGTEGSLVSTVNFVGRFRQEVIETRADETYSAVQSVRYQIEGTAAQLSRIESLPRALRLISSPDEWDEITNLTIWRAIVHVLHEHSTFLTLHDLSFDSVDNTFLYGPALGVQGSSVYDAVRDIAESIKAFWEFAPQGEARVMRDLRYETTANRNAALTYANWTTQDLIDYVLDTDPVSTVGKVPSSGGYYDSTAATVKELLALAPGLAQGSGIEQPTLTRQILAATSSQATAQSELNNRAADHEALEDARSQVRLRVVHHDGYHFLVPSRRIWYTFTIAATDTLRGLSFDTTIRWLLESITVDHDNDGGVKAVNAVYVKETSRALSGFAGQTVQYPALSEITPALPDIPPFDAYLAFPELPNLFLDTSPAVIDVPAEFSDATLTVPKDGNAVTACGDDAGGDPHIVITKKFLLSPNPPWSDITPESEVLSVSSWSFTFDFTASNGGWTGVTYDGGFAGYDCTPSYVAATGWYADGTGLCGDDGKNVFDVITKAFASAFVTSMTIYWTAVIAANEQSLIAVYKTGVNTDQIGVSPFEGSSGSFSFNFAPNTTLSNVWVRGQIADTGDLHDIGAGSTITITRIDMEGTDTNPFTGAIANVNHVVFDPHTGPAQVGLYALCDDGADSFVYYAPDAYANPPVWQRGATYSGIYKTLRTTKTPGTILIYGPSISSNALVRYSTNYGATFGSALTVGATGGSIGGFDTQNGGTVSLAARDQQVEIATTLGGAYADETNGAVAGAQALTVILPWYDLGSDTVLNSGSTPDYLLGASALIGGEALWKVVNGVGKTAITPSSGGTKALAVGPNGLTIFKGKRIAYLGNVSGTTKLFTSIDTGANWVERENVSSGGFILLPRRRSIAGPLYWTAGGTIRYSPNWGVTRVAKTTPLVSLNAVDSWS